jgi:hypothetical protein
VSKPQRLSDFKPTPKHFRPQIAEAARLLIELVRAHIDARGRVSSDLIARIAIDDRFVGVSFVDYPDEFMDVAEWRRRP